MDINNKQYWQERYLENTTGWDLGEVSPPLKGYIDQLEDKNTKILIPGAGNAHEAEYLYSKGFKNVIVVDWAAKAIDNLQARLVDFPKENLIVEDFFKIEDKFDIILEQTFFCALIPDLRHAYVDKMTSLLKPKGKLVGLLFQIDFDRKGPPFGGSKEEYLPLFEKEFEIVTMETAYNSIQPRKESELFFILKKRD